MGLRAVAGPRIPAARCHNLGPSQPKPLFSIRAPKSAAPSADISWSANLRAKCLLQNPRSILAVTPPMDRCAESNDWIHTIHGDDSPMQNCFTNQNDYGYNNNCCGDSSSCTGPCPADYAGVNGPSNGYNSTPAYAGFNGPSNGWNAPTDAGFNGPSNGWESTSTTWNGFANVPAPETTVPGATPTQNCGPQSWTGCCGTEAA